MPYQNGNSEKSIGNSQYCSKDTIDTEDHITGECCLHDATLWYEATLEQVVKESTGCALQKSSSGQV